MNANKKNTIKGLTGGVIGQVCLPWLVNFDPFCRSLFFKVPCLSTDYFFNSGEIADSGAKC